MDHTSPNTEYCHNIEDKYILSYVLFFTVFEHTNMSMIHITDHGVELNDNHIIDMGVYFPSKPCVSSVQNDHRTTNFCSLCIAQILYFCQQACNTYLFRIAA